MPDPCRWATSPSAGSSAAWRSGIGESGGYRRKIPAQPVVAGGRVFTMDRDAVVARLRPARPAAALWRTETRAPKDRSTNVGGGISVDGNTLYVATGRAEVLALDPATGAIRWRKTIDEPARCRADHRGGAALRHHDRRPAARAVARPTAARSGPIRRRARRRACWASPRRPMRTGWWSPGSARATSWRCTPTAARWSGADSLASARGQQPRQHLRGARPAGDRRQPGLRDRPRRAAGRARPAHRPAAVGTRDRRRRHALARRRLGLYRHASTSSSWRMIARRRPGPLDRRPAALDQPEAPARADLLERPGHGRRPSHRCVSTDHTIQSRLARDRRGGRPATCCRTAPRSPRSSPPAPCSS